MRGSGEPLVSDVLVIGGGLAALSAAYEAASAGAEVVMAVKGKLARSGNTIVAACNISLACDKEDVLPFADDILTAGRGVAEPVLARTLAADSLMVPTFLNRFGIEFLSEDGIPAARKNPGHRTARTFMTKKERLPVQTGGLSLTLPLADALQQLSVKSYDGLKINELVVEDGRVVGAVGTHRGEQISIRAGAVILAAGGGGNLYAVSNNTADMTGDGVALAFKAGATVRDMEFVQFHPTMGLSPVKMILPTTLFDDGAQLRNCRGERFLQGKDGGKGDERSVTRDGMSRAIWRELKEGRGVSGGVSLDLRHLSDRAQSRYAPWMNVYRKKGYDLSVDMPIVGLATHFMMGGVSIDEDGVTSVAGLFAAGEVTGGVHGANRLGGNALTESIVFGRRAGVAAASYAGKNRQMVPISQSLLDDMQGSAQYVDVIREVRDILWRVAGVVRNEAELQSGLDRIEELKASFGHEKHACSCSQLLMGEAIVRSALARQESRGAHYRDDYPEAGKEDTVVELSFNSGMVRARMRDFRIGSI